MYHKKITNESRFIIRDADSAWIPFDEGNRDYTDFLDYLDKNNLTLEDIPEYLDPFIK